MSGMFKLSMADNDNRAAIEPDPENYTVESIHESGRYLIVRVRYPNCPIYEGLKILVLKDVTPTELASWSSLDPHFYDGGKLVARITPGPECHEMLTMMFGVYVAFNICPIDST